MKEQERKQLALKARKGVNNQRLEEYEYELLV